ncbi:glycoside hydrolase family 25 protein [uncultured Olegusella sp.]|uniref:glycoside hydrolase family 25 protein n=1 Tax=uncultured Olegusella sp. TaxID=1979846 RepID=UPI00261602DC|nr:glycoside hydrolase family 25 protein [uncultured Olegusella sp.]
MKAARKAGKPFGFYHFFRGRGIAEADFFIETCERYFGHGVPILDVETEECTKSEVQAFVDRVHAKTGVWCWIYTSASFIDRFMNAYVKAHCGLWCAGYPTQPTTWTKREFPYERYTGGCTVVGWQFTDRLKIGGKSCDGDAIYITPEQWAEYANPKKKEGKPMALPLYEKFVQVMEHLCRHDGNGGHGYTQGNRWGDGTWETLTLSDGSKVKVARGDRDCSSGIISALETVGVDCRGASAAALPTPATCASACWRRGSSSGCPSTRNPTRVVKTST